jgi:hypothetical protein
MNSLLAWWRVQWKLSTFFFLIFFCVLQMNGHAFKLIQLEDQILSVSYLRLQMHVLKLNIHLYDFN